MQRILSLFFILGQRLLKTWVRVVVSGDSPTTGQNIHYVMESASRSDAMLLANYCAEHKLPAALHSAVSPDKSNIIALPRRRKLTDYPSASSELVLPAACDIVLQPVSIYWGRAPASERSFWKLLFADTWTVTSSIRKLFTIIFNGRETRLHFGEAVKLKDLLAQHQGDRVSAQQSLVQAFRDYRTGIIGPDLSHRRTVVQDLLLSETVQAAIRAEAAVTTREYAQEQAARYANEIASDFSYATTRVILLLLEWIWTRIYKGVSVYNNEQLISLASRYSLVYVPCHRSHIDSFLLGYALDVNKLPTPNFAAGINMNMPIIGGVFRRLGAFYLRRSFKDNDLYKAVFSEYLYSMFSQGSPISYYVEGGRSRSGRTLPPRAGMLSMTVRSYLRDPVRPIAFVPVYAGYEKIIEERSYLGELRGKSKKGESLFGALSSVRHLFSKFGRVYLNFGTPIILDDVLEQAHPGWKKEQIPADGSVEWLKPAVSKLAELVGQRINEAVVVHGVNLTALALLSTPRQAMDESNLHEQLALYCRLLEAQPYSDAVVLTESSPESMIKSVEELGLIDRIPNALGDILRLLGNEAVLMTYYRNNVLHLFALPALIAALFRLNDQLSKSELIAACQSIYPYLRAELQLHWTIDELEKPVVQWLKVLKTQGLLEYKNRKWLRPPNGSIANQQLTVLGDSIRPTMERIEIVMAVIEQTGGKVDRKQLAEQCLLVGQRLAALHGFNAPEFFDPVLFNRFIELLGEMGALTTNPDQTISQSASGKAVNQSAHLILDNVVLGNIALLSAESAKRSQTGSRQAG